MRNVAVWNSWVHRVAENGRWTCRMITDNHCEVTPRDAEPYSALYVHLVVQIMYGWVHLNKILPSPQQLKTPADAQKYCKKLLGMKYDGAYDRQQCMSVMLSFNHDLWEDEEYHAAKRESNPHWRRKKEVYSAFQPGHVCFARIVPG